MTNYLSKLPLLTLDVREITVYVDELEADARRATLTFTCASDWWCICGQKADNFSYSLLRLVVQSFSGLAVRVTKYIYRVESQAEA